MRHNYEIILDNGNTIELERDEPIDIDAFSRARWWTITMSPTEVHYLNIAHITIIKEKVDE